MNQAIERVAVTGLGAVTALGQGANHTFAQLLTGRTGIGALTELDLGLSLDVAVAEIKGLRVSDVAPAGQAGIYSRADALALLAASEAIEQAGVGSTNLELALGTTGGGVREATPWLMQRSANPLDAALSQKLIAYPLHATAARLASRFPNIRRHATFCSACSSSATAIVQAALRVSTGSCTCAIAGGAESLSLLTLTGFSALGATSQHACRPFDIDRAGMTLGEGAAFLVLESETHARARGAQVLAWLDGWALAAEAHHMTHPEATGRVAAQVISHAIAQSGVSPADLGYYNAHGTGTVPNDAMESSALRRALGADADRVLVSSCKGQLGHTLGAAGAVEAVVTALSLQGGIAPPTVGLVTPAADTQLNHVIGESRPFTGRHAISSSFGFGGLDVVLLLSHSDTVWPKKSLPARQVVVTAAFGDAFPLTASAPGAPQPGVPQPGATAEASADPLLALDPERSRRFDRLSAVACTGAERVLAAAALDRAATGLVIGNSLGNTNRLCASLERVKARGARGMAPAEFPHLVHSAVAANTSIYCSLTGPVTSISDDGLCCGAALAFAAGLIHGHLAEAVVAGFAEALDDGAESITEPYTSPHALSGVRRDISQWFVLESEQHARDRNQPILARVVDEQLTAGPWYEYLAHHVPVQPNAGAYLVLDGVERAALDQVASAAAWRAIRCVQVPRSQAQPSGGVGMALLKALQVLRDDSVAQVVIISKFRQRTWVARLERGAATLQPQNHSPMPRS
jgi:3-oxoacyl-[acyl-carrier-protein] synthase II